MKWDPAQIQRTGDWDYFKRGSNLFSLDEHG